MADASAIEGAGAAAAPGGTKAAGARRSLTLRLPQPLLVAVRVVVAAIIIAGLYLGRDILVPLALAVLLAFVLDPWVARLRRWHVPRGLAVAIVTACAVAGLAGATLLAGQQLMKEGARLPLYQSTIESKLRALRHHLTGDGPLHSATRLIDSVGHEVDATRKALEVSGAAARAPHGAPVTVRVAAPEGVSLKGLRELAMPVLEPMLTGGIAVVLLVFILLQRSELRDRLMHLAGGNLQQMTEALGEAAHRVSRYLTMQLAVNTGYGAALAAGLYVIGVPGAALWGMLGATLRFVPYLGPVVASAFPLAVALAVDPGWNMLLWTAILVLTLEMLANHFVEPWLIGRCTGLAAVAIVLSVAFWTALWGPVGLVLATPLTVCLVVIGRHLPPLRSLSLLLAQEPVFDAPKRLYQRLLARDLHEAGDLAGESIARDGLPGFYETAAIPALGLAASERRRWARGDHRQVVVSGMAQLVQGLQRQHPLPEAAGRAPQVLCVGLRGDADALGAAMLAHALGLQGTPATALDGGASPTDRLTADAADAPLVVCLATFHPEPQALMRHACQRLHGLRPGLAIVACTWLAPPVASDADGASAPAEGAAGTTAWVTTLGDAMRCVQARLPRLPAAEVAPESGSGAADEARGETVVSVPPVLSVSLVD